MTSNLISEKSRGWQRSEKIARLIADMVRDGEALMLDASSTDVYIARALKEKEKTDSNHKFRGGDRRAF